MRLIPFDFLILIPLLGTHGSAGNGTEEVLCTRSGELSSDPIADLPVTALPGLKTSLWGLGPSQILHLDPFSYPDELLFSWRARERPDRLRIG